MHAVHDDWEHGDLSVPDAMRAVTELDAGATPALTALTGFVLIAIVLVLARPYRELAVLGEPRPGSGRTAGPASDDEDGATARG